MRNAKVVLFGLCLVVPAFAFSAQAADVTLKMAHFWPAGSKQNSDIFQAWADTVEAESDGRIAVEIYPSQTLAKADQSYQATVNGIADITATVQAYTAGRFPLSQIVELPPFGETAEQGSCVFQKLYEQTAVAGEYGDTHVLFLFTHGPGYVHTSEQAVREPGDLQGLRLRRPTSVVANMLEDYGAKPVGMPAPEIYQSLQRGVIDGLTISWEGMHVFRLTELLTYHVEVPIYRLGFVMTMNKSVYERLPAELQQVIDDNSGLTWARKAGRVFDGLDQVGRETAVGSDRHKVVSPENAPGVVESWQPALERMEEVYLSSLEEDGLPAREIYQQAEDFLADCSQ